MHAFVARNESEILFIVERGGFGVYMFYDLKQCFGAIYVDPADECRFSFVLLRYKHSMLPMFFGKGDEGQNAAHRPERPIEREFSDKEIRLRVECNFSLCQKVGERNRKVKHRPFFLEI